MPAKKKEGKKKKKGSPRTTRVTLSDEDSTGERASEIEVNFEEEFTNLCKRFHAGVIPEIIKKEPVEEEDDSKKKRRKSKKDKKEEKETTRSDSLAASKSEGTTGGATSTPGAEDSAEGTGEGEEPGAPSQPLPPPPPSLFVTYEDSKKTNKPISVSFEAVDVESAIITALGECLQIFKTLSSIKFKRCFLPGDLVLMLGEALRVSEYVTELIIDGCPHPEQHYYALVRDGRSLELLILRGCKINDEGAKMIASELYFKEDFKDATTLFYLNLSVNMIGDRGARALAKALRTNRTLLALTLTCNLITDVGAIALANVLKDFELIEDEVVDRRNHIYHRYKTYMEMREEIIEQLRKSRGSPESIESDNEKANRKSLQKQRRKRIHLDMEMQINLWKQIDDVPGIQHPFVRDVFPSSKKLWCHGNIRLSHLNISYNCLTLLAVEKFLQVVAYQSRLKMVSPLVQQYGYTGLTNLILQGNLFPIDCAEMAQVLAYIAGLGPAGSDQSLLGETATSVDRRFKRNN